MASKSTTFFVLTLGLFASWVYGSCWKIVTADEHFDIGGFPNVCVTDCDTEFPKIYPGGNCSAPVSTGSQTVFCSVGVAVFLPDEDVYCSADGDPVEMTVPSGITCQGFCPVLNPR